MTIHTFSGKNQNSTSVTHAITLANKLIDKNLALSRQICERLTKISPYRPDVYFCLANILYLQGQYHEAIDKNYARGL